MPGSIQYGLRDVHAGERWDEARDDATIQHHQLALRNLDRHAWGIGGREVVAHQVRRNRQIGHQVHGELQRRLPAGCFVGVPDQCLGHQELGPQPARELTVQAGDARFDRGERFPVCGHVTRVDRRFRSLDLLAQIDLCERCEARGRTRSLRARGQRRGEGQGNGEQATQPLRPT
jgi:hypothetical protein